MHIEQYNITNKIHLLVFDTQKDVASTFLRFQEFYESPEFRGKTFSLDEFKKWYVQNSPNGQKKQKNLLIILTGMVLIFLHRYCDLFTKVNSTLFLNKREIF